MARLLQKAIAEASNTVITVEKPKTMAPNVAAASLAFSRFRKSQVKSSAAKILSAAMATICFGSGTSSVARKSGENGADSPFASSG